MAHPSPASLTRVIGHLSLASGAALLVWPLPLGRLYGIPRSAVLLRAIGARDIAIGVGVLRGRDDAFWLRGRAIGDALDAVLIAVDFAQARRSGLATIGRIGVALGSVAVSMSLARHAIALANVPGSTTLALREGGGIPR